MGPKSRKWAALMGVIAVLSLAVGGGIAWLLGLKEPSEPELPKKDVIDTEEPDDVFKAAEKIEGDAVKRVIATWPDGSDREVEYINKEDNTTVKRITYTNSGRKQQEKIYSRENGEETVQEKAWDERGILMYVRRKKGDKLHGRYKKYWPTGFCREMGAYVNGKKHGLFVYWFDNGIRQGRQEFKNGKPDGMFRQRDESGTLIVEGRYGNGEKTGEWVFYDKGGQKMIENFSDTPGQDKHEKETHGETE